MENIVRKGEIACNKQFLLFSQCFPQLYICSVTKNAVLCGNGLRALSPLLLRRRDHDVKVGSNRSTWMYIYNLMLSELLDIKQRPFK